MGFFSGIKKAFKKVFDVAKVVAPVALLAGAVIFSGGAALGLAPLGIAGGWGAAASTLTSSLGLTGTLGSVLTGAVTNAGFGALAGGALSLVTGGDPMKGIQQGALAGGVAGGIGGALGMTGGAASAAEGASNISSTPATMAPQSGFTAQAASSGVASNGAAGTVGRGFSAMTATPPAAGPSLGVPQMVGQAAAPATAAPGVAGGAATGGAVAAPVTQAAAAPQSGFLKFLNDNPAVATMGGQALTGFAQGVMSGEDAKDVERLRQQEYDRRAGSYSVDPAVYSAPGYASNSQYQTPEQKYGRRRWQYDRETRSMVKNA